MNIFYFSKIITIIIRGISNLILFRDRRRDHKSLVLISVVGGVFVSFWYYDDELQYFFTSFKASSCRFPGGAVGEYGPARNLKPYRKDQTKQQAHISFEHNVTQ